MPVIPITLLSVLLGAATVGAEAYARKRRKDTAIDGNLFARLCSGRLGERDGSPVQMQERLRGERESARHSLAMLDQSWTDYVLDPEDYYLRRPLLRSRDFDPTRKFQDALLAAQSALDECSAGTITADEGEALRSAVDEAWMTWDEARRQAERIGSGDLPPAERAAARRCAQLAAIIGSAATGESERQRCVEEMYRALDKLTKVPARWEDIAASPQLYSALDRLALEIGTTQPPANA